MKRYRKVLPQMNTMNAMYKYAEQTIKEIQCRRVFIFLEETKMLNNRLLNLKDFEIDEDCCEDVEKGIAACKRLTEKWTPELETQMLEAFIKLYYDDMYEQWGPDGEEESKEYWPEIKSPAGLIKHIGTDVTLYALEDSIYAKSKTEKNEYESQNVDVCVILVLDCPWDEEHGWAAVFVDEKFVKVDRDIVDCVWLD